MECWKIEVFGVLSDVNFHKARSIAEDLYEKHDLEVKPYVIGMMEIDWDEFAKNKRREYKGKLWSLENKAIIFADDELIGDNRDFLKWAAKNYSYTDFRPESLYAALTEEAFKGTFDTRKCDYVFMDVAVDDMLLGQLIIELYRSQVPKTCENFKKLCTGEIGESVDSGFKLDYAGSIFHRIVPNGWIQGGDIWQQKGDGGESIFGKEFEDENFSISHDKKGIVGLANKGTRHSNGSQFYITLKPSPWFDTKHVAFGRVIEGSAVLRAMEEVETLNQRPLAPIKVVKSGLFSVEF